VNEPQPLGRREATLRVRRVVNDERHRRGFGGHGVEEGDDLVEGRRKPIGQDYLESSGR